MKHIITHQGSLLNAPQHVIVHQVNCQGVMGAGLAKQIKYAYPRVYNSYINACKTHNPEELLGKIQVITIPNSSRIVVNFFAQLNYGRDKCYTDYQAFRSCCRKLDNVLYKSDITEVAFPYGIGAGLAGGDSSIIHDIIENSIHCDIHYYTNERRK